MKAKRKPRSNRVASDDGLAEEAASDAAASKRPGAVFWVDPSTGRKRCTAPNDRMFSTAVMFSYAYADESGNEVLYER